VDGFIGVWVYPPSPKGFGRTRWVYGLLYALMSNSIARFKQKISGRRNKRLEIKPEIPIDMTFFTYKSYPRINMDHLCAFHGREAGVFYMIDFSFSGEKTVTWQFREMSEGTAVYAALHRFVNRQNAIVDLEKE
jgi:hypothetical protein